MYAEISVQRDLKTRRLLTRAGSVKRFRTATVRERHTRTFATQPHRANSALKTARNSGSLRRVTLRCAGEFLRVGQVTDPVNSN